MMRISRRNGAASLRFVLASGAWHTRCFLAARFALKSSLFATPASRISMTSSTISVTRSDLNRLEQLFLGEWALTVGGSRDHIDNLRNRLSNAVVVDSVDMLPDVITMNSSFYLKDSKRDESDFYTLVYPDEACIAEGKLSILSPLGAEVFGRRVGETIDLLILEKVAQKEIAKLSFQPERVGAFNL